MASSNAVPIPSETTNAELASALEKRFAALHPDVALFARLPKTDPAGVNQRVDDLEVILRRDPKALDRDFSELDVSGLTPAQLGQAEAAHRELRQLVRAFPGLCLREVLADPRLSPADKAAAVSRRGSFIERVRARAGEGELLYLDFSPDSADLGRLGLEELGASAEEQKLVVDTLKSYQRIYAVTNEAEETQRLIENGYSSAVAIATRPFGEFRAHTNVPKAETYWRDSRATLIDTMATVASIIDVVAGFSTTSRSATCGRMPRTTSASWTASKRSSAASLTARASTANRFSVPLRISST
jgi:hypothetical protein